MATRNRIVVFLVALFIAGFLGVFLANLTPSQYPGIEKLIDEKLSPAPSASNEDSEPEQNGFDPPVYFHAALGPGAHLPTVIAEIHMAANAGIHRHILAFALTSDPAFIAERIKRAQAADPNGRIYLQLDLNPSEDWLAANPAETSTIPNKGIRYPSVASATWVSASSGLIETLANHLRTNELESSIEGVVIGALDNGQWYRTNGYDSSDAITLGFREWLAKRYTNDESLQAAWGSSDVTLVDAQPPAGEEDDEQGAALLALPNGQPRADFHLYLSTATAQRIVEFTALFKEHFGPARKIFVPYGYTLESSGPDSGHFALAALLESDVDGFLSPVSSADRGLGGLGGLVSPVHSALLHGKEWIIFDNTRTGIALDPATKEIRQPLALQIDNFATVQRRNFSVALINGLGFALSDPAGSGNLHNKTLWAEFGRMRQIYRDTNPNFAKSALDNQDTLTVVVEEESWLYESSNNSLNTRLAQSLRQAVFQAGVQNRFVLLKDLLDGTAPQSKAYLFMNAFRLDEQARTKLHTLLDEQDAAAIWLYAPGYLADAPSVESIESTVLMKVKEFSKPRELASKFTLSGNWISQGTVMDLGTTVQPLFYIKDDDTDVLSRYAGSEEASGALKFLPNGSTSVYVCPPHMTTDLLREILEVLEFDLAAVKRGVPPTDTLLVSEDLILLHARDDGERAVNLRGLYDVVDLFDPAIGWRQKRMITLSMKLGETRLLRLSKDSVATP